MKTTIDKLSDTFPKNYKWTKHFSKAMCSSTAQSSSDNTYIIYLFIFIYISYPKVPEI